MTQTTNIATSKPLVLVEGQSRQDILTGQFCYTKDAQTGNPTWLHFWPRDCPSSLSAPILPERNRLGVGWTLSGTEDQPTLKPPLALKGVWNGCLKKGVARRC